MTNSFEQVTKYKMTILQIAFSLSVNIYVRKTKQRSGKVSWKKKPRHRDVTKKKERKFDDIQRTIARQEEEKEEDEK